MDVLEFIIFIFAMAVSICIIGGFIVVVYIPFLSRLEKKWSAWLDKHL
jgi:hypothetical protein